MTGVVVAIDGPAGSGKSSVSRAAARELGYGYQDTGAAYRAFAWYCLEHGVDLADASAVTAAFDGFEYGIGTDPDDYYVRVGVREVTAEIREPRISAAVSAVAGNREVRALLVELFRRVIAEDPRPGIVVEGRDITTVVAPDAAVRILLTADEAVRIARRAGELTDADKHTAQQLVDRDRRDARMVDFMSAADGVTTLDSTALDFEQTVRAVVDLVRGATA
ncbi:cytidylate kinase [Diaminobutyricimonas aerilata]|uniref:Cytidylate kinase n=1 Tax=Diaminobutyricimonas aerilata TaxID=1162967 RepID=A0A2M9CKL9_9MICO|nr:(d)CMP kinase [Diaminobutyricimonas aerilata]PJJ72453.1 cytidylate kinase [Diaminobutyricimonas aerilata]